MTKCWQIELKLTDKTLKTFVYSDTGTDIETRFKHGKAKVVKEIDDPISGTIKKPKKQETYI